MLGESFNIFLWLIILLSLSFLLANFWNKIFSKRKYRIFVFLGVIVHELSHAVACFFTGAKIKKISFFSSQGGYVRHSPPKIPVLGKVFIAFAPVLGGIGILWLISWLFGLKIPLGIVNFSQPFFEGFKIAQEETLFFIENNWLNYRFWPFIYLVISIIICLTPSKKDFKNALGGLLAIFVLGTIFYYLGFFSQFLGIVFHPYLGNILVLGVVLGFLALFSSLAIYLISYLINLIKKLF